MKKSFFAILFLVSIISFSQTQTKRYNSMTKRYEYFDSRGNMIGYEFYNKMTRQWEYYENQSQNSEPQSLDISNLGNATTILQGRYDSNTAYVQQEINKMMQSVYNLDISDEKKSKIIQTFKNFPLNSVNSQTINYSSLSKANDVLNYLNDSLRKIVENVIAGRETYFNTENQNKTNYSISSKTEKTEKTENQKNKVKYNVLLGGIDKRYKLLLQAWNVVYYDENRKEITKKYPVNIENCQVILDKNLIKYTGEDGNFVERKLSNFKSEIGKVVYSSKNGTVVIYDEAKVVEIYDDKEAKGKNITFFLKYYAR